MDVDDFPKISETTESIDIGHIQWYYFDNKQKERAH